MSEDDIKKTQLIQQLDQAATSMENIAELMAAYYKALVAKGLSPSFAENLVMSYSENFWLTMLQGNKPNDSL